MGFVQGGGVAGAGRAEKRLEGGEADAILLIYSEYPSLFGLFVYAGMVGNKKEAIKIGVSGQTV